MRLREIRTIPASLAIVCLLASGLAGCGQSDEKAGGDGTYDILAFLPLSGPLAVYGKGGEAALKAAVKVINENRGFAGRDARLTIKDDKGDPAEVAALTQAAVAEAEPPDLIFPGMSTNEVLGGLKLTSSAGILATSTATNEAMAKTDLYMSSSPPAGPGSQAVVDKVVADGAKSVALIVSDDETGLTATKLYKKAAEAAGINLVASERVPGDSLDATGSLDRIRAAKPDAIMMSMFGPVVSVVLKARTKVGLSDTPTYGDQTVPILPRMATPADLKNFQLVDPSYLVKGTPIAGSGAMTTAVKRMEEFNGGPIQIPMFAYIHSYMSLILTKYAADKAGSTAPKQVYKARTSLDTAGMPLYAGTSGKLFGSGGNFPDFTSKDYISFPLGGFEHGFFVPAN
ncbi:ABC transporter substrate-binding protein [Spirillospora sp. CA-255316]